MKNNFKRNLTIFITTILVAILIFLFYKSNMYTTISNIFTSPLAFKKFVVSQGIWAPLVFSLLQIIQVIISPIPGNITTLAGGAIFGGINACYLSGFAIIVGSVIAFYLARIFGKPLVIKLIGEKIFNKYNNKFLKKGKFAFLLLFLLPFFPDDALCFLAGLSKFPFKMFLIYTAVGRLPSIIIASLAGSGAVNLTPSGWIIIGILSVIAIYISIRYGKLIENKLETW